VWAKNEKNEEGIRKVRAGRGGEGNHMGSDLNEQWHRKQGLQSGQRRNKLHWSGKKKKTEKKKRSRFYKILGHLEELAQGDFEEKEESNMKGGRMGNQRGRT